MKEELFYADCVLIASTDPGWLQLSFDFLTGLFDWVGLRKNVRKTVGMVSRPFRAYGVRAYKAYTHRMTGEGRSFKERQRERVLCPECGKELAKVSLVTHRQTQHDVDKGRLGSEGDNADGGGDESRTYKMGFLQCRCLGPAQSKGSVVGC